MQISHLFASIPRVCSPREASSSSQRGLLLPSLLVFRALRARPSQGPETPPSFENLPHPPRPQLGTFDGLADTIPSFFDLL